MTDAGEYQVAIFDAIGGYGATLRATLARAVGELDLDPAVLRFLDETTIAGLDPKLPRVGVLFSDDAAGTGYAAPVGAVLDSGAVVIPVVRSVADFPTKIPAALAPVNALELNPQDTEFDDVAARALEILGLLRDRRRLFISYRRAESTGVAQQLHDRLDARSFDVFLDTLSVRPADLFQETLWHRMADSDLVVLLYTASVLDSGWVTQELARANGMGITVLQAIWPGVTRDRRTELFEPVYLAEHDFEDAARQRLTPTKLNELVVVVERLRARSLAAREAVLVGNLCDLARLHALEATVQPTRYVDLKCPEGGPLTRVIPALGVPDAQAVQHGALLPATQKTPQSVVLLYDALSVAGAWLEHLAWLDRYLPVKLVKTETLPTWLPSLCACRPSS